MNKALRFRSRTREGCSSSPVPTVRIGIIVVSLIRTPMSSDTIGSFCKSSQHSDSFWTGIRPILQLQLEKRRCAGVDWVYDRLGACYRV